MDGGEKTLPNEVIREIVSWLPVKDVLRFRCVSKECKSFISEPTFVKLHLQRSSTTTHLLLKFKKIREEKFFGGSFHAHCSLPRLLQNPSSTLAASFHHDYTGAFYLMGVCNGLVWLHSVFDGIDYKELWVKFWNPATRVITKNSPRLHFRLSDYMDGGDYRYVKCGFGYDDWSDTYKVVAILFNIKLQQWEVRVYRLGDTCWRKVSTFPAFPILLQFDGQLVNGTLNWLALRRSGLEYEWKTVTAKELMIFEYDIKKETYRYLMMPDNFSEVPGVEPRLGVLKGCLVCSCDRYERDRFVVWIMREFGNEKSWTELLNIRYEQCHVQPPVCVPPLTLLCMSENDDVLLLVNNINSEFMLYNRRDNTVFHTESYPKSTCGSRPYGYRSYDFVPSLVLS